MRVALAVLVLAGGVALAVVSYFLLAAPLGGPPSHEGFSNPRVPFATVFFIAGVALVFLSAIIYELLPEQPQK